MCLLRKIIFLKDLVIGKLVVVPARGRVKLLGRHFRSTLSGKYLFRIINWCLTVIAVFEQIVFIFVIILFRAGFYLLRGDVLLYGHVTLSC